MNKKHKDLKKLILDSKYYIMTISDEHAIDVLDTLLEDWLYYKDHCPFCGHD